MVTVSSAFISSRRARISFSVLSASDGAGKAAAWVDVLRALCRDLTGDLGKTDFDNTGVARDHSFHCIAGDRIQLPADHFRHVGLMVSISNTPHAPPTSRPSSSRQGSARWSTKDPVSAR